MLKLLMTCDKCGKEITGPYKSVKNRPNLFISNDESNANEICLDCWNLFMSLKEVPSYDGKVKE